MILKPVPFKARAPTTIRPTVRLPAPSILGFLCVDEEKSGVGEREIVEGVPRLGFIRQQQQQRQLPYDVR
jgi:hypothetical protein